MQSEFELIRNLVRRIPKNRRGKIGIGDDAGILRVFGERSVVVTADTLVEGVDFLKSSAKPEWVGRKALAMNLSDIAAMGARPLAFVIALGIPKNYPERWLEKFYDGMRPLTLRYQMDCLGGDISRSRQFFAAVTMLGSVRTGREIQRKGARAGDAVFVTGSLGGSILGKHFLFEPRVEEAEFLAEGFRPTAMIDVSDGLVQDLEHILEASGAGAEVCLDQIPIARDAFRLSGGDATKALKRALSDGEDFELVFTLPRTKIRHLIRVWPKKFPKVRLSCIGKIISEKNKIVWLRKGQRVPAPKLSRKGFTHF